MSGIIVCAFTAGFSFSMIFLHIAFQDYWKIWVDLGVGIFNLFISISLSKDYQQRTNTRTPRW